MTGHALEYSEWLDRLAAECQRTSQPAVAARIRQPDGFPSPTVISQALNHKYPSARGLARLQRIVEGAYLARSVECPILGDLTTDQCEAHQSQPFAATNMQRVRLFKACHGGCPHSKERKQ